MKSEPVAAKLGSRLAVTAPTARPVVPAARSQPMLSDSSFGSPPSGCSPGFRSVVAEPGCLPGSRPGITQMKIQRMENAFFIGI